MTFKIDYINKINKYLHKYYLNSKSVAAEAVAVVF